MKNDAPPPLRHTVAEGNARKHAGLCHFIIHVAHEMRSVREWGAASCMTVYDKLIEMMLNVWLLSTLSTHRVEVCGLLAGS